MSDRFKADTLLVIFVTLLFLTVISDLATRGMALDGTLYAGIARDLAAGLGSFWFPTTFITDAVFYDHPPLGIYLQSLMFALVGDHFWTENLYSGFVLVLTLFTLVTVFRQVGCLMREDIPAWYGIFVFCIFPLSAWTYTNNYLENTLTLISLLVICVCLLALRVEGRFRWLLAALSGLLIVAGLLVKGPVAMWPLAFFPMYFVVFRERFLDVLKLSAVQLGTILLVLFLIWKFTEGGAAIQNYFANQLVSTFSGARPAQFGRAEVLIVLFKNLSGPVLFTATLLLLCGKLPEINRWGLLFFLLALSASLPLMLSPRQYEHYLLPSLPLFAVTFGIMTRSVFTGLCDWLSGHQAKLMLSVLLLGFVAIYSYIDKFGEISDDRDHLEFVSLSEAYLAEGDEIQLCDGFEEDRIRAYLYRYLSVRSTGAGAGYELCLFDLNQLMRQPVLSHGPFELFETP